MNYVFAFVLCLAGSVLHALTASGSLYWLLVSDANVAIWLWVAWYLGRRKHP